MYNILYILCIVFYEDNNRILVILVCSIDNIDVAKSVKKIFQFNHSIEI